MGVTKLWVHFYAGFAIGIFWYYKGVSIILPFVMIEINFDRDATGWCIFNLTSQAGEK